MTQPPAEREKNSLRRFLYEHSPKGEHILAEFDQRYVEDFSYYHDQIQSLRARLVEVKLERDTAMTDAFDEKERLRKELAEKEKELAELTVDCEECGGQGWVIGIGAACCGKMRDSGNCCGQPVPEQVQEQCPACGGSGRFPAASIIAFLKFQLEAIRKQTVEECAKIADARAGKLEDISNYYEKDGATDASISAYDKALDYRNIASEIRALSQPTTAEEES